MSSVKNLFEKQLARSPSIAKSSSGTSSSSNSSSAATSNQYHLHNLLNLNQSIAYQSSQNNQNLRLNQTNNLNLNCESETVVPSISNSPGIFNQNHNSVDASQIKTNGALVYEHIESDKNSDFSEVFSSTDPPNNNNSKVFELIQYFGILRG